MSFIEHFCDMSTKEDHLPYVRMIQRDIIRILDAVVPSDGSGVANLRHVRRILNNLHSKEILSAETMVELDAALKDRESQMSHDLDQEDGQEGNSQMKAGTPRNSKSSGMRLDKRQIEQRIEEDRERNKRQRESMWAVTGDDIDEAQKYCDQVSETGEDDFVNSKEEDEERWMSVHSHLSRNREE